MSADILQLESLNTDFKNKLILYKQANIDYIDSLNSSKKYTTLPNKNYWGSSGIKEISVATTQECEALCSSDATCTGATFDSLRSYCWTRSGTSAILDDVNSSAIVPQSSILLSKVASLNEELITLQSQIKTKVDTLAKPIDTSSIKELDTTYSQLLDARVNIASLMQQYQDIEQNYNDKTIYVEQTNSSLTFWIIIAIIVMAFTVKVVAFPEVKQNTASIIFWIFISVLILLLTMHLNSPSTFSTWGLLVLLVVLMKVNIIPSP